MVQADVLEQDSAAEEANEAKLVRLWDLFIKTFCTDLDCFKELYRIGTEENIFQCALCGRQPDIGVDYRTLRCGYCKISYSLTAGTLFAGARKIKAWLGAIWVMERGAILSSSRFHKLAGIAQSSALNILRKVRMAVEINLQADSEEAHSSLFWFIVHKRSRETPARSHPSEEEQYVADDLQDEPSVGDSPSSPSPGTNEQTATTGEFEGLEGLDEGAKRKIFDALSSEPLSADDLCSLTGLSAAEVSVALIMLEFDKLVTKLDGDRYVRQMAQPTPELRKPSSYLGAQTRDIVDFIMIFIYRNFHGSSRKYLQNYASAHWWHSHRNQFRLGKLIKVCLLTEPITYNDIIAYVTPPLVKI